MNLTVTTDPTTEPVQVSEAADWLRLSEGHGDDTLLAQLIESARRWAESYTRRALLTQTITLELDSAEGQSPIWLPRPPFQSLTSFKRYETDDTLTAITSGAYYVSGDDPARLVKSTGTYTVGASEADWAAERRLRSYQLVYVAGYGAARGDVPWDIREAILRRVASSYETRVDAVFGTTQNEGTVTAESLLAPYRYGYL